MPRAVDEPLLGEVDVSDNAGANTLLTSAKARAGGSVHKVVKVLYHDLKSDPDNAEIKAAVRRPPLSLAVLWPAPRWNCAKLLSQLAAAEAEETTAAAGHPVSAAVHLTNTPATAGAAPEKSARASADELYSQDAALEKCDFKALLGDLPRFPVDFRPIFGGKWQDPA
jgi:hypothetical protein